jgi:transcriptional regulator with XRE-family HTH domain/tetratricopeptide (TPR) repeat protein
VAQSPRPLDPAASPRALFGAQLRLLREGAGHSQASLGRALYVAPDTVATWEKARSLPDAGTVRRLEQVLDGRGLLTAAHALAARPHADTHADRNQTRPAPGPGQENIGFMYPPTDVLDQGARDAAAFGLWAEQATTGPVAIELLHQQVREIAAAALTLPPMAVMERAAPLARHVYDLARAPQQPRQSRDLHLIAAQVCTLMAWISGDIGRLPEAELYAATAIASAEAAGEPETTAWAWIASSKTAFWRRDYTVAIERARRGAILDPRGTAAVMLACQRADAASQLGDAPGVHTALTAAAAQNPAPDAIGGLLSCGPVRHLNYAAAALYAIGQYAPALAEADRALAAPERLGFGTIGQIQITRALAHAATGDIEAATAAARPVLDLPAERRLATLTARIRPLADLPAPALTTRGTRALAEEVREFCRTTHRPEITAPHEETA